MWTSEAFTVNASNSTTVDFDISDAAVIKGGAWQLYYQKRVINASTWVTESINQTVINTKSNDESNKLFGYGLFNPITVIVSVIGLATILRPEDEEIEHFCQSESHDN